jgi:hypothetical protein
LLVFKLDFFFDRNYCCTNCHSKRRHFSQDHRAQLKPDPASSERIRRL